MLRSEAVVDREDYGREFHKVMNERDGGAAQDEASAVEVDVDRELGFDVRL